MSAAPSRAPHPVVWTILYLPFGALGGFISVALTFVATQHGLSITEGALLNGAQMIAQWLKWIWAPIVDVTLTPRRWYLLSTTVSAFGVLAMASVPLAPSTLGLLLGVIAAASLVNTVVGMAVEAIMAATTPPDQVGRVSAWFQAGNLGGAGLGGALGIVLLVHMPRPWMAGAVMGGMFMLCPIALLATPVIELAHEAHGVLTAVRNVIGDLKAMLRTKGGLTAAILCVLPIGTGAAQGAMTQAKVAAAWGAGEREVALLQGLMAGLLTTAGCFAGGWLCQRLRPRTAYAVVGLMLSVLAVAMAVSPFTVRAYVGYNLTYSFVVGLTYAAFTSLVLLSMGTGSAATKYNVFASLANLPIWWMGLLMGAVTDRFGASRMLVAEASIGVVAVAVFAVALRRVERSALAEG